MRNCKKLTSSNHIMGKMISGNEATCLMSRTWLTARLIWILARALRAVPIVGWTSMNSWCFSASGGEIPFTASLNNGSAENSQIYKFQYNFHLYFTGYALPYFWILNGLYVILNRNIDPTSMGFRNGLIVSNTYLAFFYSCRCVIGR